MRNLEQIRAANALNFCKSNKVEGDEGGNILSGLPALIMNNGLLAVVAFAKSKSRGWKECMDAIARHLASEEIGIIGNHCKDLDLLLDYLTNKADSRTLKQATDEALAWLSFAKRFNEKNKKEVKEDSI